MVITKIDPSKRMFTTEDARPRLLAINFGGIGDEILFLPTLKTIRQFFPNWSITLLLEPRSRSVEQLTDLIDEVVTFDIKKRPLMIGDLLEVLGLIKAGSYDCIVSSGGSPMVSALLFLSGVRERVGYGSSSIGRKLLTEPVPLNKNQYAGGMYHDLAIGFLRQQNVPASELPPPAEHVPEVTLKKDSVERMKSFLKERKIESKSTANGTGSFDGSRLVVLHPGTSRLATEKGIIKTWPTEKWIELLSMFATHNEKASQKERVTVILAGGPDDKEIIEEILASPNVPLNLVSAFGHTKNIADLAALIHLSDLMICVDSAPMHVSVGLDHRTVALFGPTNPALLIPDKPHFHPIWDKRDGNRSMFDRLGVVIAAREVFETALQALALQSHAAYL